MLVKGTLAITTTYTLASSVIQDYIPLNVIEYVGWRLFIFKYFWNAKNSDIESAYQIGVDNSHDSQIPIGIAASGSRDW